MPEKYAFEDYSTKCTKINEKQWYAKVDSIISIMGIGATEAEAINNLKKSFDSYKKSNELPNPLKKVKVLRSSNEQIKKYEEILIDFCDKIFNLNYRDCFISDDSMLIDFTNNFSEIKDKISNEYGVRITKKNMLIIEIIEKIVGKNNR